MRINKYVAQKKYASRREADVLIEEGKVFINGKRARLGDIVEEGDTVEVRGEKKTLVYYAYYKPAGLLTLGAGRGERDVFSEVNFGEKVFPVGRLDKDSEGLLIFTNDGRLTTALLDGAAVEKEYSVSVNKPITHQFLVRMHDGVKIGAVGKIKNYTTKKAKVRRTGQKSFDIVLTEGRNRQIRRMCGALGYEVVSLKRFRIGGLRLGNLGKGTFKKLQLTEVAHFFKT